MKVFQHFSLMFTHQVRIDRVCDSKRSFSAVVRYRIAISLGLRAVGSCKVLLWVKPATATPPSEHLEYYIIWYWHWYYIWSFVFYPLLYMFFLESYFVLFPLFLHSTSAQLLHVLVSLAAEHPDDFLHLVQGIFALKDGPGQSLKKRVTAAGDAQLIFCIIWCNTIQHNTMQYNIIS